MLTEFLAELQLRALAASDQKKANELRAAWTVLMESTRDSQHLGQAMSERLAQAMAKAPAGAVEDLAFLRSCHKHTMLQMTSTLSVGARQGSCTQPDQDKWSVEELVDDIVTLAKCRLQTGVRLSVVITQPIPKLNQPPEHIFHQSVTNAVLNAAKCTTAGHITITLSYEPDSGNTRTVPGFGGVLQVQVTDSGLGMTENQQSRLLSGHSIELSDSRDQDCKVTISGSAMKLACAQTAGVIEIKSKVGEGSELTLTFNVEHTLASAEVAGFTDAPENLAAKHDGVIKVLVVDDEQFHIQSALTMVESLDQNLNVQIAVALGPQDALAHIRENRIDVIFIEFDFASLSSLHCIQAYLEARNARTREPESNMQDHDHDGDITVEVADQDGQWAVFLVSQRAMDLRTETRLREMGIDGVLVKPFSGAQIHRVLLSATAHGFHYDN